MNKHVLSAVIKTVFMFIRFFAESEPSFATLNTEPNQKSTYFFAAFTE